MFVHFRIRRWVLWWFYIGIACGVVAIINILSRNLTRTQEEVLIGMGVMHWVLGGIACYFYDSVQTDNPTQESPHNKEQKEERQKEEWHEASDFLLPGGRQSLLPPRH
jgi:hypothetical protein